MTVESGPPNVVMARVRGRPREADGAAFILNRHPLPLVVSLSNHMSGGEAA